MHEKLAGKKVLLTGHTGFKGTWMIHLLRFFGAEVYGYALEPEMDGIFQLTKTHDLCDHFVADIRDVDQLKSRIVNVCPDIVLHFAAQPLVLHSYSAPLDTFHVNGIGTAHLLEGLRDLDHRCICIIITTDKVYEDKKWVYPYRENDTLGGFDPYSASKTVAEIISSSYRNSFFNPQHYSLHNKSIVTARAGNVIGGGDTAANRIIPDVVKAYIEKKPIELRYPEAVRPWQHVLDALSGYLHLIDVLDREPDDSVLTGSWNFGPDPNDVLSVQKLVELSFNYLGGESPAIKRVNSEKTETSFLTLDSAKARRILGWKPKWTSEQSIERTIDWYKRVFFAEEDPRRVCEEQIKNYFD